ncbi:pentatricopeptide repeat-containing protein At3g25210, mitochondrial [Phoenix dactylifera]|uniref:Pentatricopeptide repeat-containing protein At3g25210, mitochondrial n=1 Tax=Phoenix dactylifera TaxID=42345 RepID=A0A8B7CPS5_PHODC|nr:pentatricopeptide repeat-containing protein At3g25210, mitochondrial [Phoenix dactylifera]
MGVGSYRFLSPILSETKRRLLAQTPGPPSLSPTSFLGSSRALCSAPSSEEQNPAPPNPNPDGNPNPSRRTRTPLEKQFESWVERLRPGFAADDVEAALRAQSDPDLALDLFRWTALQRGYRHTPSVYLAMLHIAVTSRRFSQAEALVDEILAGACPRDLALFNAAIHFCCSRRHLFSRAFDVFKKMQQRHRDASAAACCRPNLQTYSMLLGAILRRFNKPPVSYVYLHAVRSLVRQMKASGVIPDTFAMNLIIKAYSRCLEMDEAIRVFKEMGLYGCEANEFTYGYITKGLCEKGRIDGGMGYFKEMREKGLVPSSSVYMALVSSLALERRFEEAIKVLFDMLANSMAPDMLTYRTLLEGLCREGRTEEAFELLEELGRRGAMNRRMYSDLLDGLHWLCQPHD